MNRSCGTCNICCIAPPFDDPETGISKEPHQECSKLCTSAGTSQCTIYKDRPKLCDDFWCSWMKGPSEWKWGYGDEDDRPDKNGLLIFQDDINNGSWFFVIECEKDALLNGKNIISDIALNNNTALIVQKFGSKKVAGDEAIIRNDLVPRAKQMLGKFLRWVDEDNEIGLYELNNPAEK